MNLLIGCGTMAVCLVIQCYVVTHLVRYISKREMNKTGTVSAYRDAMTLITAMLVMMVGTFFQIAVWGELFVLLGEFENFPDAFYHSAVNYSSLGYGDIVMSPEHRLLGALEAANGVLMFGLSTSLMYSVIRHQWTRNERDK
ncbi:MAG: ion channel [Verrucomicrobiales bacterium]